MNTGGSRRRRRSVESFLPTLKRRSGRAEDGQVRVDTKTPVSRPGSGAGGGQARAHSRGALRVARQPILDSSLRLIGYELLYRAQGEEAALAHDHGRATSAVIVDGILDVGVLDLVGDRLAYLNVSREFLLSVRPLPLPPRHVVLELLEDQHVDGALLEVLGELVAAGFTIALDDFRLTPETEPLLDYARIVKVDVLEHTGRGLSELLARLRAHRPPLQLLAEKVETREQFERCCQLGFEAFQGYFFAMPAHVGRQRLPSQGLGALSTMGEIHASQDFDELHRIITRDAGLSMRLLRYANSAYVSLPRRVGSVHEGLAWLGTATVRRFALMVAMAGVSDAPSELLLTALIRARLCQLLSGGGEGEVGCTYFTVGLFSLADALADAPMWQIVEQLPFRQDIAEALLERRGEMGELLDAVIAYQRGDFDAAGEPSPRHVEIAQAYRDAVEWADRSLAELL